MKTFAIASPFGGQFCYDYVVYLSLRQAMERLGLKYNNASPNKIYLIGHPNWPRYETCINRKDSDFTIALIGSGVPNIKRDFLSKFSMVFTTTPESYTQILKNTGIKPDGIWNQYSPFEMGGHPPKFDLTKESIPIPEMDVAFVGNARPRPAVEALMSIIDSFPGLKFNFYGKGIDKYRGNPKAKQYWAKSHLPYHQFPEVAKKAKVVLLDMHSHMSDYGMPSFKLIDFMMCGAFTISAHNVGAPKYLGALSFNSNDELKNTLHKYLNNPMERGKIAKEGQNIVQKKHGVSHTAAHLAGLILTRGRSE